MIVKWLGIRDTTGERSGVTGSGPKAQGLLAGELPPLEELQKRMKTSLPERVPPQNISSLETYRELIEKWEKANVEVAAMHQRLSERGYTGSYAAVWRFVRRLKETGDPDVTVRVETKPGEGSPGRFWLCRDDDRSGDGKLRKTWAFVMTLAWSRHQYVEFVWDQKIATFLRCHRNAFEFFGGIPERVRIDNLKAAILKAVFDDPQVQQSYRECAEHYGFLIAPCKVATPEHKGKVEQGGVHYVKRNFLGGREATTYHASQPGCAGLVSNDCRAAHPRHDQRETPGAFRANRKRDPLPAAGKSLRSGGLETRQGVPGLLCDLSTRLSTPCPIACTPARSGFVAAAARCAFTMKNTN